MDLLPWMLLGLLLYALNTGRSITLGVHIGRKRGNKGHSDRTNVVCRRKR